MGSIQKLWRNVNNSLIAILTRPTKRVKLVIDFLSKSHKHSRSAVFQLMYGLSFGFFVYQLSWVIWCQNHPSRRNAIQSIGGRGKRIHAFPNGICLKANIIVYLGRYGCKGLYLGSSWLIRGRPSLGKGGCIPLYICLLCFYHIRHYSVRAVCRRILWSSVLLGVFRQAPLLFFF